MALDLCEGVGPLPLRAQAAVQGEALGAVPLLWGDRSWIVESPRNSPVTRILILIRTEKFGRHEQLELQPKVREDSTITEKTPR